MTDDLLPKAKRGFAALSLERRRELATMGGKSVPAKKRSFSTNPDLAAQAGRKGGQAVPPEKRGFSQNRDLGASTGMKGGRASQGSDRKEPAGEA